MSLSAFEQAWLELQAKQPQKKKPLPPLLDEETRKLLTRAGWTNIRQSNLNRARSCMKQQELALRSDTFERYSINAVLGIIVHIAAQNLSELETYGHVGDWWIDIWRAWAQKEKPKAITYGHRVMTNREVETCVLRLGEPLLAGRWLSDLIVAAMRPLILAGGAVIQQERTLRYVDGEGTKYPITFSGTLDLLINVMGLLALFDLKNYGLLDAYVPSETAKIAKQSMSDNEVVNATQLRHYAWLLYRTGSPPPEYYGYIWPANLVPYQKNSNGYQKGDLRGESFKMVRVKGLQYVQQWEADMVAFLKMWARTNPRPRMFPQNMGNPQCPSCSFYQVCMADTLSDQLRSNPALSYLYEKE